MYKLGDRLFQLLPVLVAAILCSCGSQPHASEFRFGITLDEFMSTLPSVVEVKEIVEAPVEFITYSRPPVTGELDTIARVGPYTFLGQSTILLARLRRGRIQQYDIVFTRYDHFVNPMLSLLTDERLRRHSDPKEPYWHDFVGRGYGTESEFRRLTDSLKERYGTPSSLPTKNAHKLNWASSGVTLRAQNGYSTIIISFVAPGQQLDTTQDWEFCGIIDDSTLLGLKLGIKRSEVDVIYPLRDTVFHETPNQGQRMSYSSGLLWGIPSDILFAFDTNQQLISYRCEPRSFSGDDMLGPFRVLSRMIASRYGSSFPDSSATNSTQAYEITLKNSEESIYEYYSKPSATFVITKNSEGGNK